MKIFNFFKSKQTFLRENIKIIIRNEQNLININNCLIKEKYNTTPLIQAETKLSNLLFSLKMKREIIEQKWAIAYENFSWWNKLKYADKLDLSDLDKQIRDIENAYSSFEKKYKNKINKLNNYFEQHKKQSIDRIKKTSNVAINVCARNNIKRNVDDDFFRKSFWLGILSIPISIGHDFYTTHNVYEALRKVNGNFSGMSDSEIFWETLWMSDESLTGLSSLTKGAYFEFLVANDTGGDLFEHFNHPNTDIIIDGAEIQIKATDSVSYISSVDDNISVIATTEVAERTGVIDSGYTNEELSNSIELALGGGIVDSTDALVDAILTSVGSLGVFATIRGINHAQEKFDNGMDGIEAIFEGAGVAIEGTAKGVVDASEMVYNIATSKPSKFIGGLAVKGLTKLDRKLSGY